MSGSRASGILSPASYSLSALGGGEQTSSPSPLQPSRWETLGVELSGQSQEGAEQRLDPGHLMDTNPSFFPGRWNEDNASHS